MTTKLIHQVNENILFAIVCLGIFLLGNGSLYIYLPYLTISLGQNLSLFALSGLPFWAILMIIDRGRLLQQKQFVIAVMASFGLLFCHALLVSPIVDSLIQSWSILTGSLLLLYMSSIKFTRKKVLIAGNILLLSLFMMLLLVIDESMKEGQLVLFGPGTVKTAVGDIVDSSVFFTVCQPLIFGLFFIFTGHSRTIFLFTYCLLFIISLAFFDAFIIGIGMFLIVLMVIIFHKKVAFPVVSGKWSFSFHQLALLFFLISLCFIVILWFSGLGKDSVVSDISSIPDNIVMELKLFVSVFGDYPFSGLGFSEKILQLYSEIGETIPIMNLKSTYSYLFLCGGIFPLFVLYLHVYLGRRGAVIPGSGEKQKTPLSMESFLMRLSLFLLLFFLFFTNIVFNSAMCYFFWNLISISCFLKTIRQDVTGFQEIPITYSK